MATSPANISANVGQVGGTPLSPADVNNYLSQLGGSLNGFAGSVSNVLNYLLVQNVFISKTVRVGILGNNISPPYPGGTGVLCGLAAGGAGTTFTPAATGRVLVVAIINATLNFPQAVNVNSELNAHVWMGRGKTGPNAGTSYNISQGPLAATQVGGGWSMFWAQGASGGTGLQMSAIIGSAVSNLTMQQSYWMDLGLSTAGTAATGPTALASTSLLVVEY